MSQPTALIIGDEDVFAHKTALCLAEGGFAVHALSPRRGTALRWSRHVTAVHRLDWDLLKDPGPELVARLEAVATHAGADVIFPVDESPIQAVGAIADQLETPTVAVPNPDVFDICNDKHRFAEFCDQHGLPQPPSWQLIPGPDEIPHDLAYPVIAKPRFGGGGVGVVKLDSQAELADHMRSGAAWAEAPLLVQDFIPGIDVDCSFLAESGRIIASAVQTRRSMHDRTIHFLDRPDVVEVCDRLVAALDYDGLAHVDLRVDDRDDSVRVIETNPRVWGSVAYAMQAGINFPALAADRAVSDHPAPAGVLQHVAVTNTPIGPSMLARSALRRGAPSELSTVDAAAWEANADDPLPNLAMAARRIFQRVQEKVRPANRTA